MWLLRKHVVTRRPSQKLDVRRLGPYAIVEAVGKSAFRLQLPPTMQIHPLFHVSLLEPHVANTFSGRVIPPPLPEMVDSYEEFEVHQILDSRIRRRRIQYLVDWVGYDASERTWEPLSCLGHATAAVASFHSLFPLRPRPPVSSSYTGGYC